MADAIEASMGEEYTSQPSTSLYATCGSAGDYLYSEFGAAPPLPHAVIQTPTQHGAGAAMAQQWCSNGAVMVRKKVCTPELLGVSKPSYAARLTG